MYHRIKNYGLNYCEDAILDLIDPTVKVNDMINLEKPVILQEIKKLYDGMLQHEYDSDTASESLNFFDYYVLSEGSDTGEIIGFRN